MSSASALPTHIADLAGVIVPLGQWNGTEVDGGWPLNVGSQLCAGNETDTVGRATLSNVYARRRVFINVYLVIGLCAFGFVGNALTVAVLRRDKVSKLSLFHYYFAIILL